MPPAEPVPYLDPLSRLAIRFGTDKFGGHLYTPSYHQILGHLREKPVRLLEIGVGGYNNPDCGGSSLRMWAEYFPYGKITGLDINPKNLKLPPRVSIVQGSQDDAAFLARVSAEHGPFDIVIDDGSHRPAHMIASLWALYPLLNPDGIYIIEDTQTCFIESAGGNKLGIGTIYPFAYEVALQMHGSEGYVRPRQNADVGLLAGITASVSFLRNVICFHRGSNSYPSNTRFSLADPAVAGLLATIEQQAAIDPSPRSVLSRVDIYGWACEYERAGALALAAMQEYPDELEMLQELHFMTVRMPLLDVTAALEARIAVLKK
jgi:hypothetical protein